MKKTFSLISLTTILFLNYANAEERKFYYDCGKEDYETIVSFYDSDDKTWSDTNPKMEQFKNKIFEFKCEKKEKIKKIKFELNSNKLYSLEQYDYRGNNWIKLANTDVTDKKELRFFGEKHMRMLNEDFERIINRYKASEDKLTYVDTKTNKMWEIIQLDPNDEKLKYLDYLKKRDNMKMSYIMAEDYCEELNLAGYSDWRLPTYEEYIDTHKDRNIIYEESYTINQSIKSSKEIYNPKNSYYDRSEDALKDLYVMFSKRDNSKNKDRLQILMSKKGNLVEIEEEDIKYAFHKDERNKEFVSCIRDIK